MTRKLIAWTVLALVAWGGYRFVKAWENPWTAAAVSPIAAVMPKLPDGCSEKCK